MVAVFCVENIIKGVETMKEQFNPFEAAMNATAAGEDPFASSAGAFGEPPQESPAIDLGSQPTAGNPFEAPAEAPQATAAPAEKETSRLKPSPPGQAPAAGASVPREEPGPGEIPNPIADAMERQEQGSIFAKLPIFEHGAVREAIRDTGQTFEELRMAKADDFPELEDGARVTWEAIYGKTRKSVPSPKKTKIGEFKKSIETSKEFMDALKKDRDKSPDCIIKPRITAQSKGKRMPLPPYKGVYTNLEDAMASGKAIALVPAKDGKVYEIRREEAGTFITPSGECGELPDIKAGFSPALPPIPRARLLEILRFFRSLMTGGQNYEAIANIYWDRELGEFVTAIPKQRVTATRADSELGDGLDPARYLHYMDVHSHNVMPAVFSARDDLDEKATRLYAVIGRLDRCPPEMRLRLSNGGKHLDIDPRTAFESLDDFHPSRRHAHIEASIAKKAVDGGAAVMEAGAKGILSGIMRQDVMCA